MKNCYYFVIFAKVFASFIRYEFFNTKNTEQRHKGHEEYIARKTRIATREIPSNPIAELSHPLSRAVLTPAA